LCFLCQCDSLTNIYLCASTVLGHSDFLVSSLLIFWVIDFNCWIKLMRLYKAPIFGNVFPFCVGGGRSEFRILNIGYSTLINIQAHSMTRMINFQVKSHCGEIFWPPKLSLHRTQILEVSSSSFYGLLQLLPCLSAVKDNLFTLSKQSFKLKNRHMYISDHCKQLDRKGSKI